MGVNKIGSLFQPDYYVKIDFSPFDGRDQWKREVLPMVERGIPCLLWDVFRDGVSNPVAAFGDWIPEGIGDQPNVTWVQRCEHHSIPDGHKNCATAWHDPFCTAYNSISIMAQWAVRLGFNEIVLVGCDLNFTNGKDDHFMDYYTKVDSQYVERNNRNTLAAHRLIQASCPVPVYNATIGGVLELYPRIELSTGLLRQ